MPLDHHDAVDEHADAVVLPETWSEVRAWRRAVRATLLSRRGAMPKDQRQRVESVIRRLVHENFPELRHACIGFYWPFKGEIDLRHLVRDFLALGAEAALPVIVEKRQPLEFWSWRPDMTLTRGICDIPVPAARNPVRPTALLVPLLGFEAAGHRLGYGGGYYDRTLATLDPKPLTIGVGYNFGRLETIHPQPHDIPLDAIVTESGCTQLGYRGERRLEARAPSNHDRALKQAAAANDRFALRPEDGPRRASPPSFAHERAPTSLEYLSTLDVIALLNQLLEGERAGARGLAEICRRGTDLSDPMRLRDIAMDEARFCAMLSRHITRLGGTPSRQVGTFYDKLLARETERERIDLLNRGQGWVVRKLQEVLHKIGDAALHRDLQDIQAIHERNIQRCTKSP